MDRNRGDGAFGDDGAQRAAAVVVDGAADNVGMSMELEFDPTDSNVFYFSTSGALFKVNRRDSLVPIKLITEGLGTPTALSMSDEGYLLVGFSCGSIA